MSFYFDLPYCQACPTHCDSTDRSGGRRRILEKTLKIPLRKTKRVEGTADTIGVDHTIIGSMAAPR